MKIACKRYSLAGLSLFSIMALMMPASVLAMTFEERQTEQSVNRQEKTTEMNVNREGRAAAIKMNREEKVTEIQANQQGAFCSRFAESTGKIGNNLMDRYSKFEARQGNRMNILETNRGEREAKLEGSRSQADERRNEMYQKLEARAKTDAEKTAVEEFKKTVEAAIDTRRAAVDAAIAQFRKDVDAAISGRKDDMESAAADFKSAVEAAMNKTKADCEDGTDPETVRSNFKNSLQVARTALQNDRQGADKVGEQVRTSAEVRRVAVKKTLDEFKATVGSARFELKQAFGETTDTESNITP